MQKISYHIRPFDYVKKNGVVAFFLRLTIDRTSIRIPLEIEFFAALFDSDKEQFRYDGINDEEIAELNIIFNTEKGKANDLIRFYRLSKRKVDPQTFKSDFLNFASRDEFIFWAEQKLQSDLAGDIIKNQTFKNKRNRLSHFKNFVKGHILFSEVNLKSIIDFDNYLRKSVKLKHNSALAAHNSLNSIFKAAVDTGINFENPYKKFQIKSYVPGDRQPLEKFELKELQKTYKSGKLNEMQIEVLRKFLFSCFTGLRISDSKQLDYFHIDEGVIRLATIKGQRFGKEIKIPIPDYALSLLEDRNRGLVFLPISDQEVNRTLKEIASIAEIKKKLTFHVSRDTFATLFIELGGDAPTLMELLGHSEIKTTMIYVKLSEKRKEKMMMNFNNI
jgi:integrase/recombinase XerD